jgi:hypothetical protein
MFHQAVYIYRGIQFFLLPLVESLEVSSLSNETNMQFICKIVLVCIMLFNIIFIFITNFTVSHLIYHCRILVKMTLDTKTFHIKVPVYVYEVS